MQLHKNEGVNRNNYTPKPEEKHLVHYKAELPRYNKTNGAKESHPEILKTGLKMFETVKRNLEKQGYIIEIIYHPEGKYNTPVKVASDARDKEIEALKAQLAEAQAQLAEKETTEEMAAEEVEKKPKAKKTTKK